MMTGSPPILTRKTYNREGTREVHKAYKGGSGSVHVDTSQVSEEKRDESGLTDKHQRMVMSALERKGLRGATPKEISEMTSGRVEKGRISTAMTNLHIGEFIERLNTRRDNHYVYVLPGNVGGREIKPYVTQRYHLRDEDAIQRAEKLAAYLHDRTKFNHTPLPGDHEVARALDYLVNASRRAQRAQRQANEPQV